MGCGPEVSVTDLEAGEFAIVVGFRGSSVVEVDAAEVSDARRLGVRPGDALSWLVFALEPRSLLGSDSEVSWPSAVRKLEGGVEGALLRCTPVMRAPLVAAPGDRCLLPSFARPIAPRGESLPTPETIEQLRRQLLLEFPGEPASGPADLRAVDAWAASVTYPSEAVHVATWTLSRDGTATFFGDRTATAVSPDGRRKSSSVPELSTPVEAVELLDGSFLVVGADHRGQNHRRFFRFDRELAHVELAISGEWPSANAIRTHPTNGEVYFAGTAKSPGGLLIKQISRCRVNESELSCRALTSPDFLIGLDAPDEILLSDGFVLTLSEQSFAIQVDDGDFRVDGYRPAGDVWELDARNGSILLGRTALVCAERGHRSVVLRGDFEDLDRAPLGELWSVASELTGGCLQLMPSLDGSADIWAVDGTTYVPLDRGGRVLGPRRRVPFSDRAAVLEGLTRATDWALARTSAGAFYRARTATSSPEFVPVLGPAGVAARPLVAARSTQGVVAIGVGLTLSSTVARNLLSVAPTAVYQEGSTVFLATFDGDSGEIVETNEEVSELRSIHSLGARRARKIRRVSKDVWLVLDFDGGLTRIGGQAETVERIWDDPFTEEIEAPPSCNAQHLVYDFDAAHGLGWAVGCGPTIFQLRETGESTLMERRAIAVPSDREDLAAVRILNPDQAVVAGDTDGVNEVAEIFVLRRDPGQSSGFELVPHPRQVEQTNPGDFDGGRVVEIVGNGARLFIVYEHGFHELGSGEFVRAPGYVRNAASDPSDSVLRFTLGTGWVVDATVR
ncbi:MAG: hypothetical protein HY791_34495 [Deltaproteobacteria bacterium]|nr:hypothetical protein [Deltaproteobacteria bacterium]